MNIISNIPLRSSSENRWSKKLVIITLIIILGALGTLCYVVITPRSGATFTEFYILGQQDKAENYPRELKLGEEVRVIAGIVNHEMRNIEYRIEVVVGNDAITELGPVALRDGQTWEGDLNFVTEVFGKNQKVEFLLYKNRELNPSLELDLWIDVIE